MTSARVFNYLNVRHFILAFTALLLNACDALHYYGQAIDGQARILNARQPVSEVLADDRTDANIKQRLKIMQQARRFAVDELALPDNGSYTTYVELDQPYVVWTVFATPADSLQPRQWCFPILGCLAYRGYFSKSDALSHARRLKQKGDDVFLAGTSAYSTIGWFADPIYSSMLRDDITQLAGLVFHELAHQRRYVPNDTVFNESFATAVEQIGVERWLRQQGKNRDYDKYLLDFRRHDDFIKMILAYRDKLQVLYNDKSSTEDWRAQKRTLLRELRKAYRGWRKEWHDYEGYDAWMLSGLNNAKLASVATYYDLVPAFHALYQHSGKDLQRFYTEVDRLAAMPHAERHRRLQSFIKDYRPARLR